MKGMDDTPIATAEPVSPASAADVSGDFSEKVGDDEEAFARKTSDATNTSFYTPEEQEEVAAGSAANGGKKKLWQRNGFRLLVLFLLIGAAVGLGVGLIVGRKDKKDDGENATGNAALAGDEDDERTYSPTTWNASPAPMATQSGGGRTATPTGPPAPPVPTPVPNEIMPWTSPAPAAFVSMGNALEDDGTCDSDPSTLSPVVDDRASGCAYELIQTVRVSAPATENVTKMLSGGTSAFDGDSAVIVSYSSDGTAGAVWALGKGGGDDDGRPSWEQTAAFQTSESDQLGWGVALEGSTFVAGAPGQNATDWMGLVKGWHWAGRGKALVMGKRRKDEDTGEGEDEWYEEAILIPGEAEDTADFGNSVAIAPCECIVAVGAWHDRLNQGSVFVYSKTENNDGTVAWTETQKLAPDNTRRTQSDHLHGNYGYTVAVDDGYLAVKAPYDSYLESYDYFDKNRGVVYVYQWNTETGTYEELVRLCAPEGEQVRHHLKDMVFVDSFLLVGAPGKNKVYVFRQRMEDGVAVGYEKTAELTPSDGDGVNNFGIRLDASASSDGGTTNVLVGDLGGEASYLFVYEDGVWKERAKFDGVNTSLSGSSIVEHTPKSFEVNGEEYGGEVNFYDLVC